MNAELKVINAVCQHRDIGTVLNANIDPMFDAAADIWQFVRDYYFKHRSVPSKQVVREQFDDFVEYDAQGDTMHYVEQMREKFIDRGFSSVVMSVARDGKQLSPLERLELLQTELAELAKYGSVTRDVDVTDFESAADHYAERKKRAEEMGGTIGIPLGIDIFDAAYPTGLAPGQLIVLIGWSGFGKRISVDSQIATPNGWRRYGDLQIGDQVIGKNGKPTVVTNISNRGAGKAYRCTFTDGTSVIADPDHLWTVYTPKRRASELEPVTVTTQDIVDNGVWRDRPDQPNNSGEPRWYLPLVEPVEYDKVDLPIEPYTLGALLGDGSKVKRLGLNVLGHDRFIPDQYMTAHVEARIELLRGLMDTDGGVQTGRRAKFYNGSLQLAQDVAELVRSLGGVAKIDKVNRRDKSVPEYTVTIWTPMNPFNLERKAAEYNPKPWFKAFESIEQIDDTEMMCISVDADDRLYVVQDYTVTHNSWFGTYLACQAWSAGYKPMIVSLEMTAEEVRDRVYTLMGSGMFPASDLQRGNIDLDGFSEWGKDTLADRQKFIIIDSEGQEDVTPRTVQGKIDKHNPDLVILDYQQLFSDNKGGGTETTRNTNISRDFKRMAMTNKIPIVNLSQATQQNPNDVQDPPMIEQVAWAKSIKNDSDLAVAVHMHPAQNLTDPRMVEIVGRKNRHGPLFSFYLNWDVNNGVVDVV